MAPEQVSDECVSRLTDIYAASVVYWEALTGQRLFHSNDERSTLSKVLSSPVAPPSSIVRGLPPALDRVVMRGLDRDPSRRYPTAYDMVEAITKYSRIASSSEVGEWVASLAREELARCTRLAAAIERIPPSEGALELAARLAIGPRDSSTRTIAPYASGRSDGSDDHRRPSGTLLRSDEATPVSLALRVESTPASGRIEAPPSSTPLSVPLPAVTAPPATARRRHVIAACILAVLVGIAPAAIGRCFAANRTVAVRAQAAQQPGLSEPSSTAAPKAACDKAAGGDRSRPTCM